MPVFAKGNLAAVRHGSRSARLLYLNRAAVADEVRSVLADFCESLQPQQLPLFDQLIDTLTQLRLVNDYIGNQGGSMLSRKGAPRPVADFWIKLHRQALAEWGALGVGKPPAGGLDAAQRVRAKEALGRMLALGNKEEGKP